MGIYYANGQRVIYNSQTVSGPRLFDDWYLPTQIELVYMAQNLHDFGVGNFTSGYYWGEESISTKAAVYFITAGSGTTNDKDLSRNVRPARSFTDSVGAYAVRDVGPSGGLIFYVGGTTTYYEAHTVDLADSVWSNIDNQFAGANGSNLGDGPANTLAVINQAGHTTSAAKLCNDLIVYN